MTGNAPILPFISIHALCEEGDSDVVKQRVDFLISIHALCEEGDAVAPANVLAETYFYPRPLRGGRPVIPLKLCGLVEISIHALCEEGDLAASPVSLE